MRATVAPRLKRRVGPINVHSTTAEPGSLPTSALTAAAENQSAGPPGDAPNRSHPGRPRSWTVVQVPPLRTSITPVRTEGDRPVGSAPGAVAAGRTGPYRCAR